MEYKCVCNVTAQVSEHIVTVKDIQTEQFSVNLQVVAFQLGLLVRRGLSCYQVT